MKTEGNKLASKLAIIFTAAFVIAVLVFALYFLNFRGGLSTEQSVWGTFGDFAGGTLNPIIGLLGLLALLKTISIQSQELKASRKELRNSSDALKAQNTTLQLQNFENAFFQMLRLHNDIVNSMDFEEGQFAVSIEKLNLKKKITTGRDCFVYLYQDMVSHYKEQELIDILAVDGESEFEYIYNEFYKIYHLELSHYFRYLYQIFKFIDQAEIENKKFYSNLVRAQLSDYELTVLFYNCLSAHGKVKFKPLVEKYAILKNLSPDLLIDFEHHTFYDRSAFGGKNFH